MPEGCIDKIIMLYHSTFFAGHQGVIKTYLTISDKFFIPNLSHYLRSYIKGCHLCQLVQNEKLPPRQLQTRINPNYMIVDISHSVYTNTRRLFSPKQNNF